MSFDDPTIDDTLLQHPKKLQACVDSKVIGVTVRIGSVQETIDILLAETESQTIDAITAYARVEDLKFGSYVSSSARFNAEAEDGKIFIGWNFEPTAFRPETNPCLFAIRELIEKVLRKRCGFSDEAACKFFEEKIIWMNRCPFIMPYDADRGTNKKKNKKILDKTDPLMLRIGKRLVSNLPIESAIILGKRGYDFFIKESVFHQHQIVQDEMLYHPEKWVKGFLTEPQRKAILDVFVRVISRSLKIPLAPILENEMYLYLRVGENNTEVARAKRQKNDEETKVTKQKKPRVRKLVDELASLSTTIPHAIDAEFASIEVVAV